ncbi:MAG: hypothetical protein Q4G02_04320 [bacterium]|nr:hypothetical protein [bacterium]
MFHAQELALELLESNTSMNINDDKLMVPFFMLSSAVANDGAGYDDYDAVRHCKPMLLELMSAMVRNHRSDDFVFHHACDVLIGLFAPTQNVVCEQPVVISNDQADQKPVANVPAAADSESIFDRFYGYAVILGIWSWKLVKLVGLAMLGLLILYLFMIGMRFVGALFGRWPMSQEAIFDLFYALH